MSGNWQHGELLLVPDRILREEAHLLSGKNKWASFFVNKVCLKIKFFLKVFSFQPRYI